MSKLPRISIITPSYNQGQFIERTIKSVLSQKYPDLEYIVMDGGSQDQSVKILKKYDKQLIWRSEADHGQTHAINKGIKMATGEIVAYLNSDDTYEPGALLTIGNFFAKHPAADFVYGRGALIDQSDKRIGMYNDAQTDYQGLFAQCAISQPTAFWRRKIHDVVGLFDESFHFTMDYEFWVRVAKKYQLYYLKDSILANTRIHPHAKTSVFLHKLHQDAIRVERLHYGKVHYDWIFTFVDGPIHSLKTGSISDKALYWLTLFMQSAFLQLAWNHSLPSKPMWRQYKLWVQEILS